MSEPLTVNQALDQLAHLAGQDVMVQGILCFEFEGTLIEHFPKAERRPDYGSSIWIDTGAGALQFDRAVCARWHGKRVVVQGTLWGPGPGFGGCGHMSLCPAEILLRTLARA